MAGNHDEVTLAQPEPTLSLTAAQGRFGVDYLQLVCAHAGFGCSEPRNGEDVRALDASIAFEYGDAHIQVKCTTKQFNENQQTIRIPVEDGWLTKWQKLRVLSPIYLVVVQVPEQSMWIDYTDTHTHLAATAYWSEINPVGDESSLVVHRNQQLTVNTLREWALERQRAFNERVA